MDGLDVGGDDAGADRKLHQHFAAEYAAVLGGVRRKYAVAVGGDERAHVPFGDGDVTEEGADVWSGAPWVKLKVGKIGVMKDVRRVGVYIQRSKAGVVVPPAA